jgi:hypothetical protein
MRTIATVSVFAGSNPPSECKYQFLSPNQKKIKLNAPIPNRIVRDGILILAAEVGRRSLVSPEADTFISLEIYFNRTSLGRNF